MPAFCINVCKVTVILFLFVFSLEGFAQSLNAVTRCKSQAISQVRPADAAAASALEAIVPGRQDVAQVMIEKIRTALGSNTAAKVAFERCIDNSIDEERGGTGSRQSQFIREAKRDCSAAAKAYQEANSKRTKYCGMVMSGGRGMDADPESQGSMSSLNSCLKRTDDCQSAIRIPLGMMMGAGMDGPSIVGNPQCQFLMVGSCKDNMDRADKESDRIQDAERDLQSFQERMQKAQQQNMNDTQELKKQTADLANAIENLPEVLSERLAQKDREKQKMVVEAQRALREGQKELDRLLSSIALADSSAQAEIDSVNLKCMENKEKAQQEVNNLTQQMRAQKNSVKGPRLNDLKGGQQLINKLKTEANRKFDECMRGFPRFAALRQIMVKRENNLRMFNRQIEIVKKQLEDLAANLGVALKDLESEQERDVRKAKNDEARMKQSFEMLNQQAVTKAYMDQMNMQQMASQANQIQQKMMESQSKKQMFLTAANSARSAGDNCTDRGDRKSGSESMEEARAASVTVYGALSDAVASCCESYDSALASAGLGGGAGAQGVKNPETPGGYLNRTSECARWQNQLNGSKEFFEEKAEN